MYSSLILIGIYITNSIRSFDLRFTDETAITSWLNDYHYLTAGISTSLRSYSKKLLHYLAKEGREELRVRRLHIIDREIEMTKAKLVRLSKERYY